MVLKCVLVVCVGGVERHKWIEVHSTRELRRTIRTLKRHARQSRCDWFCILVQGDYEYNRDRSKTLVSN